MKLYPSVVQHIAHNSYADPDRLCMADSRGKYSIVVRIFLGFVSFVVKPDLLSVFRIYANPSYIVEVLSLIHI